MRKLFALFILLLWGTVASAQVDMVRLTRFEGQPIRGISVSSAFDVELIRSDRTCAVVEINAALEDLLRFEMDGQGVVTLGLHGSRGLAEKKVLRARVYLSELAFLQASGASDVRCSGSFESNSAQIDLSGASEVKGLFLTSVGDVRLKCGGASDLTGAVIRCRSLSGTFSGASDARIDDFGGNLTCDLSGSSDLRISGEAGIVFVKATGASSFLGASLGARDVNVQASSASQVDVGHVEGEFAANGSSASSITYRGTPTIRSITSSSASSVKRIL